MDTVSVHTVHKRSYVMYDDIWWRSLYIVNKKSLSNSLTPCILVWNQIREKKLTEKAPFDGKKNYGDSRFVRGFSDGVAVGASTAVGRHLVLPMPLAPRRHLSRHIRLRHGTQRRRQLRRPQGSADTRWERATKWLVKRHVFTRGFMKVERYHSNNPPEF